MTAILGSPCHPLQVVQGRHSKRDPSHPCESNGLTGYSPEGPPCPTWISVFVFVFVVSLYFSIAFVLTLGRSLMKMGVAPITNDL